MTVDTTSNKNIVANWLNIELDPTGELNIVDYALQPIDNVVQFQHRINGLRLQLALNIIVACIFMRNFYYSVKILMHKRKMFASWCCLITSILGITQGAVFGMGFLLGTLNCRTIYWYVILVVGIITIINNMIMLEKAYLALRRRRWILYVGAFFLLPQFFFVLFVLKYSKVQLRDGFGCIMEYKEFVPLYWFGSNTPLATIFSGIFTHVAYKQYRLYGSDAWRRLARDGIQTMCLALLCSILCALGAILRVGGEFSTYFYFVDCLIISMLLLSHCIRLFKLGSTSSNLKKSDDNTTNIGIKETVTSYNGYYLSNNRFSSYYKF
ncbi:hypothetical protein BDF22DRAFT_657086 [Syncephalis plumigaleata]|nr:hypothetical protein BDF22DRAFT_657086 [Syncephalis plumigaleata]